MNIFTIIIPVYNAEKTIARTLISLLNNKDWIKEIIIVNDYSTDSTMEIIESFKQYLPIITFDNNGPHNPGMARKIGLQNATGEWVTFVDADDCLTPSCLYYVLKEINKYNELYCLFPLLMYYECGVFKVENISSTDYSCVGNFYLRQYLIDNDLYPSETLKLSEDEYYGKKIYMHVVNYNFGITKIAHYDYPVYEVHHDEEGKSFAFNNWVDYLIKYHLECQQLLTNDFIKYTQMYTLLKRQYLDNFIFCYYLYICISEDEDIVFDETEQIQYFQNAFKFYQDTFGGSKMNIIKYFNQDPNRNENLLDGAITSTGVTPMQERSFKDFIKIL